MEKETKRKYGKKRCQCCGAGIGMQSEYATNHQGKFCSDSCMFEGVTFISTITQDNK